MSLTLMFKKVRKFVTRFEPDARFIRLRSCYDAERFNRESARTVCHTYHHKGIICYAGMLKKFPPVIQTAILLHEFGHIFGGKLEVSADQWAMQRLGILIGYTEPPESLEVIDDDDYRRVMRTRI